MINSKHEVTKAIEQSLINATKTGTLCEKLIARTVLAARNVDPKTYQVTDLHVEDNDDFQHR